MRLQDYPRPEGDNGFGIHFGRDLRQVSLDTYVPRLVELRLKWCLIPHTDELQLGMAAHAIWTEGIIPISRLVCKIDQSNLDFVRLVSVLKDLGAPGYIQIFNEPDDIQEWKSGTANFDSFVQTWISHASAVANAGGYPGLQLQDPSQLRGLLRGIKSARAESVLDRLWFCPHPYGANHPPNYPNDNLNQRDHPGGTTLQDDVSVIGFQAFASAFSEEIGFVPPFIAGEGGWRYENREDSRYPGIDDDLHGRYHSLLFQSFCGGCLPNGDPLPDYLFAFCPWILFGGESDAWYSWTSGTRRQTIIAIEAIPPFVRRFQWENVAAKRFRHYVLFGHPKEPATRSMLLGARTYLQQFSPTIGFNIYEAMSAQAVTIIGDNRAVGANEESQLRSSGCHVERLSGDQYTLDLMLAERVARNAEFG